MKINSEQEMLDCGRDFAQRLLAARSSAQAAIVVELRGDLGAGKTTFTRGLATGLGVTEPITSPSFTISKRYALPSGGELIHYDFYRLPDPGLMADELAESISNPADIIVIEWGDSVIELLGPHTAIEITKDENDGRLMRIEHTDRNDY